MQDIEIQRSNRTLVHQESIDESSKGREANTLVAGELRNYGFEKGLPDSLYILKDESAERSRLEGRVVQIAKSHQRQEKMAAYQSFYHFGRMLLGEG